MVARETGSYSARFPETTPLPPFKHAQLRSRGVPTHHASLLVPVPQHDPGRGCAIELEPVHCGTMGVPMQQGPDAVRLEQLLHRALVDVRNLRVDRSPMGHAVGTRLPRDRLALL